MKSVYALDLTAYQRRAVEVIAKARRVPPREIVRRAVVAYVSACFEDVDRNAEVIASTDKEPDLAAWQNGEPAFATTAITYGRLRPPEVTASCERIAQSERRVGADACAASGCADVNAVSSTKASVPAECAGD